MSNAEKNQPHANLNAFKCESPTVTSASELLISDRNLHPAFWKAADKVYC